MSILTTSAAEPKHNQLGNSVPPYTAHAISVSLPTWRDNVDYEEGKKRVLDSMVTGYPRFFIHKSIQKLAHICEGKFGNVGECCMLFPTLRIAEACRSFMVEHAPRRQCNVRLVWYPLRPDGNELERGSSDCTKVHVAFFREDDFKLAKQFWQHTGLGISSRYAERCINLITTASKSKNTLIRIPKKHHYSLTRKAGSQSPDGINNDNSSSDSDSIEDWGAEYTVYLEERYARNLPFSSALFAKRALRRRIAGVLVDDSQCSAEEDNAELSPSSRGIFALSEDDVYLFPTGMSAIWSAHQTALAALPQRKSVCFGFPYTDTLKVLQKWGPGCHFFGSGLDSEIDSLEVLCEDSCLSDTSDSAGILALFCEFPSNPLLRSPNLPRLRALADKYGFLIIVDETIGNFVNVAVLPFADIVVSSLTKVFSGDSNVMGGSLVLNPQSRHYELLKSTLKVSYEDTYFAEDVIVMERNSRDFMDRIRIMNRNTEAICDFLYSQSLASGKADAVVKEVFYPKWTTREIYDLCRHPKYPKDAPYFGGLFSVTFLSDKISQTFFDALACHKGPSLGTNFTLACPYTILAHYNELDWALSFGVEKGLVRVSVGLESEEDLLAIFREALESALKAK